MQNYRIKCGLKQSLIVITQRGRVRLILVSHMVQTGATYLLSAIIIAIILAGVAMTIYALIELIRLGAL